MNASVIITPVAGVASSIQGTGDFAYDQASKTIRVDNAHATTAATSIDASGVLGATLNVHAQSSNLDEILPVLKMIDPNAPREIPVKLNHGRAEFQGSVTGAIVDPRVHGQIILSNAVIEGHTIDKLTADLDTTKSEVHLDRLTLLHGPVQVDGSASAVARNGSFDDAAISAQLNVHNASISDVAKEWKIDTSVSGIANGSVRLSGTVKTPIADVVAQVESPAGFGEKLDSLRANVRYANDRIEVSAGEANAFGGSAGDSEGAFDHRADDLKNGTVRFQVAAQNVALATRPACRRKPRQASKETSAGRRPDPLAWSTTNSYSIPSMETWQGAR